MIVHIDFKIHTLVTKIAHVNGSPPHIKSLVIHYQDITQSILLAYRFECYVVMEMALLVDVMPAIKMGCIAVVVGVQGTSKIIFI